MVTSMPAAGPVSAVADTRGWGKGGVAPHAEPAPAPGRAAAGTMPGQVSLTSRRQPMPPGAATASPHSPAGSPPVPLARGLAVPARLHMAGWVSGPTAPTQHGDWLSRATEAGWHPARGHGASLCRALVLAWRWWEMWGRRGCLGGPPCSLMGKGGRGHGEHGPHPRLLQGATAFGHKNCKRCRGTSQPHRGE